MKKQASIFLCMCFLGVLGACSAPTRPPVDSASPEVAAQYQTISALLTRTAQVTQSSTAVVETQATVLASRALSPTPRARLSTTPSAARPLHNETPLATTPAPEANLTAPCDLALSGRPIDVSVPDDSRFQPEETFSKTWRLVNGGSCTWTREYAVVWFSGDDLGLTRAQNFNANVPPGKSVDVTVEMRSPAGSGVYQSNWKLRNAQGELFGIGPGALSPFWARIVVVPVDTPTVPIPTREPTSTPGIYVGQTLVLLENSGVDLDSGLVDQGAKNDLLLRGGELPLALSPENGARLALVGMNPPGLQTCLAAPLSAEPVEVDQIMPGAYLCYRTGESLPGRVLVLSVDLENRQVSLEFITWFVP